MSRQLILAGVALAALSLAAVSGCRPQQPYFFCEDGDLSHYIGVATEIDYPDVEAASLDDVNCAMAPFTLENQMLDESKLWDLSLEEAMQIALRNSKVVRLLGPGSVDGPLSPNPQLGATIYDPALTESDPRFGVEGALSAFDAQFSTSAFWENNDNPRNAILVSEPLFRQHLGTFEAQITKLNATGGRTTIRHNVNYDWNNNPANLRPFPSEWNVNVEAEVRQPLLQGAGALFNRIAGPGSIPGFYNGVAIARLRNDQSLTDFDDAMRNLASDVERAYWALYLRYRRLDTFIEGRDLAQEVWQKVDVIYRKRVAATGEQLARAKYEYYSFRSAVEGELSELYKAESNLRYLMGLAPADGRLIRPVTEATTAKVEFDWCDVHCEALARNVDLRKQKWAIKQAELELIAAKNYLLPRLDFVGRYRWNGMGDELLNSSGNPSVDPELAHDPVTGDPILDPITGEPTILNGAQLFAARFDNAYTALTDGDYQDWQLGLEFSLPFGFRREMAGVRNAKLSVARERAILQDRELLVTQQLSDSLRDLAQHYTLAETRFNQWVEGGREFDNLQNRLEKAPGEVTPEILDRLLNSLRRKTTAESEFYSSVVRHSEAIKLVHFHKGSLLEYNGVYLAEGPWPQKAYFDAHRLARKRDASYYFDFGFTRPKVLSRGPYAQHAGAEPMMFDGAVMESEGTPTRAAPRGAGSAEVIPTPEPEPTTESTNSETGTGSVRIQLQGPKLSKATGWQSRSRQSRDSTDLAELNLDALAGKPAMAHESVRRASYAQGESTPPAGAIEQATGRWINVKPSGTGSTASASRPTVITKTDGMSPSAWKRRGG